MGTQVKIKMTVTWNELYEELGKRDRKIKALLGVVLLQILIDVIRIFRN